MGPKTFERSAKNFGIVIDTIPLLCYSNIMKTKELFIYRCDGCKDVFVEEEPAMELGGAQLPHCDSCYSHIEAQV